MAIKKLFKKEGLKEILSIFFASRIMIFAIGIFSSLIIIKGNWFGEQTSLLDLFIRWDSGWYLGIINNGYSFTPGQQSSIAFFPLYPLLTKLLSFGIFDIKIIGFLISNLGLLVGAIYLYKLVKIEFNDKIASKSVFYMLIFPTSFFFSTMYTEGLFIGLAITSFYYARKQKWLTASLLGFLLSLTKVVGFIIFVPLLMEYLLVNYSKLKTNLKKTAKDLATLLIAPAGLLSYMLYLYLRFNDPLAFYHTQTSWKREFTTIFSTLSNSQVYYAPFFKILYLGAVIFAAIVIIYGIISKIRPSYTIYSICMLITYLSFQNLDSIPRYIASIFPLYIFLAKIGSKNKFIDNLITLLFIMLLSLLTIMFVNGYWMI